VKRIGIATGAVFITGMIVLMALAFRPTRRGTSPAAAEHPASRVGRADRGPARQLPPGLQSLRSPASILIALALSFASGVWRCRCTWWSAKPSTWTLAWRFTT
jgi:hypothetical protein